MNAAIPVLPLVRGKRAERAVSCRRCGMYGMCLSAGLESDPDLLERVVARQVKVRGGETLIEANAPFDGIYAVKSGAFKTTLHDTQGNERVVDLHLPGELVGLDAVGGHRHGFRVQALGSSSVCHLRFDSLEVLGPRLTAFQQALVEGMSEKLRWTQWLGAVRSSNRADQAVAAFLWMLLMRYAAHGLFEDTFRLPVSRQEIAHYLGLAMETVSRSFARLQAAGLMVARGRSVRVLDRDALCDAAGTPVLA